MYLLRYFTPPFTILQPEISTEQRILKTFQQAQRINPRVESGHLCHRLGVLGARSDLLWNIVEHAYFWAFQLGQIMDYGQWLLARRAGWKCKSRNIADKCWQNAISDNPENLVMKPWLANMNVAPRSHIFSEQGPRLINALVWRCFWGEAMLSNITLKRTLFEY